MRKSRPFLPSTVFASNDGRYENDNENENNIKEFMINTIYSIIEFICVSNNDKYELSKIRYFDKKYKSKTYKKRTHKKSSKTLKHRGGIRISIGRKKPENISPLAKENKEILSLKNYKNKYEDDSQKLAKDSPEEAEKRAALEKEFESQPKIVQFIQKNIILILLICIVLLYWIRDNIHWNRLSALGYLILTIMMIYTSKVVAQVQSGIGGALSAVYFLEWLLVTKLRWNSVMNVFNIIFSGIEVSNKDMHATPVMYVKE